MKRPLLSLAGALVAAYALTACGRSELDVPEDVPDADVRVDVPVNWIVGSCYVVRLCSLPNPLLYPIALKSTPLCIAAGYAAARLPRSLHQP